MDPFKATAQFSETPMCLEGLEAFSLYTDVGGCQNYGPFLGTLHNRCRTILGTLILTTIHIALIGILMSLGGIYEFL